MCVPGNNKLFIDGGHNISASLSIANWIKSQGEKVNLIVGMMKGKEHEAFIKSFEKIVSSITLIDIPNQEGSTKARALNQLTHFETNQTTL